MCDAYGETLDVAMRGMQVGLLIGCEEQLDKHTPKTSSLFGTKGGAIAQRIRSQMLELIQDPSASVEERREVVLRRLIESMVERREELISDHHSRDEAEVHAELNRCPMKMCVRHQPEATDIVIEGRPVIRGLTTLSKAC
ncbi:hypothetical protein MHYP_G00017220 [Metynnis hypsauchen]